VSDDARTPVVAGIGEVRSRVGAADSELRLGGRAILAALRDARIGIDDVDGVVRFDREATWEFDLPGWGRVPHVGFYDAVPRGGGSAPALFRLAAMAVHQGLASTVLVFHARNPAFAAGPGMGDAGTQGELVGPAQFQAPFGVSGVAAVSALVFRRYLVRHRTPAGALEAVTLPARRHGARNPRALRRRALTAAEYRRAAPVADPLRAPDVAPAAAGAAAFVVTSLARARGARRPVRIVGTMQAVIPSALQQLGDWFAADRDRTVASASRAMFRRARLAPGDVGTVYLDDATSPLVLLGLEDHGLCRRGGAAAFLRAHARRVNPHGGQLACGDLDGVGLLAEAVRRVRASGTRTRPVLVAGSPLEATSAVLLSA
jgi:acetyl-CoA acetyltransferase